MRPTLPRLSAVLAAGLAITACSAAPPSPPSGAKEPPPASTPPASTLPAGASGKVSAEMAGKVSPVPAFMGGGEHWSIDIQGAGDMRHEVTLRWAMGERTASGELFYRGAPGVPHDGAIALDGTLEVAGKTRTLRVEIVPEACTDDADVAHDRKVKVVLQDEPDMTGCGDLAVY